MEFADRKVSVTVYTGGNSVRLNVQIQATEVVSLSDSKSYAKIISSRLLKVKNEWLGEKLLLITLKGDDI